MSGKEVEFRDKSYNLLWFKIIISNEYKVYITFKNGKKTSEYS